MVSMAEIPVEIISSGYSCCMSACASRAAPFVTYTRVWVDGATVDVEVVLGKNLGALVDGAAGTVKDAAKHVLGDTELQALAGELNLGLLSLSAFGCAAQPSSIIPFSHQYQKFPQRPISRFVSQSHRWLGMTQSVYLDDGTVTCDELASCSAPTSNSGAAYLGPPRPDQSAPFHRGASG